MQFGKQCLLESIHYCIMLPFTLRQQSQIMPKSCIVCRAVASQDILLQYCDACQSALYCSKACQRKDWRKQQHKQICKLFLTWGMETCSCEIISIRVDRMK
jgi:hypothetical protein